MPTSIVYDQLHEVEAMTTEVCGAAKRPEDFRFMVRLARQQGERLGRAYLDFGEPLPVRKRLEEMRADSSGTGTEIERIALDVEHRINRATPVTPTAVVSLALLGARFARCRSARYWLRCDRWRATSPPATGRSPVPLT